MEQAEFSGIHEEILFLRRLLERVHVSSTQERLAFYDMREYFLNRGYGIEFLTLPRKVFTTPYQRILSWFILIYTVQFLSLFTPPIVRTTLYLLSLPLFFLIPILVFLKKQSHRQSVLFTCNEDLSDIIMYANTQKSLLLLGTRVNRSDQISSPKLQQSLLITTIFLFVSFLTLGIFNVLHFSTHTSIIKDIAYSIITVTALILSLYFGFLLKATHHIKNPFSIDIDNLSGIAFYRQLLNVLSLFPSSESRIPWLGILYTTYDPVVTVFQSFLKTKGLLDDVNIEFIRFERFGVEPKLYLYVDPSSSQNKFQSCLLGQVQNMNYAFPLPVIIKHQNSINLYYKLRKNKSMLFTSFSLGKLDYYSQHYSQPSLTLRSTYYSQAYAIILECLIHCLYPSDIDLPRVILEFVSQGEAFMKKYLRLLSSQAPLPTSRYTNEHIKQFNSSPLLFLKLQAFHSLLVDPSREAKRFLDRLARASSVKEFWKDLSFFTDTKPYSLMLRALEASSGSSSYALRWIRKNYGKHFFPVPSDVEQVFLYITTQAFLEISRVDPRRHAAIADEFLFSSSDIRIGGALQFYLHNPTLFLKNDPLFRISRIKTLVNNPDQYPYIVLKSIELLRLYSESTAFDFSQAHLFNPFQITIHKDLLSIIYELYPALDIHPLTIQALFEKYISTYIEGESVDHAKQLITQLQ